MWRQGVLQIWVTRSCDKACFGCTQASNLGGKPGRITVEQFEVACQSLQDYFGVVGVFGGNPALHPQFEQLCKIMQRYIPFERRGLWCNKLFGNGAIARETFNPHVSNINVHLDQEALEEFRRDWPEARPVGVTDDSRHASPYYAMQDMEVLPGGVPNTEENRWKLIGECDVNQYWSAMIGVFRGELRGYFCEIAGAMAMLHQEEPDYPDTGLAVTPGWWNQPMAAFEQQARFHCHACGVPLKGRGELAIGGEKEQCSKTHESIYKPKSKGRLLEIVTHPSQIGHVNRVTEYIQNSKK